MYGHDAADYLCTSEVTGGCVGPEWSVIVVYVCGPGATADAAFNYTGAFMLSHYNWVSRLASV